MPCDARFEGPIKLLSRGLVHTLRQAAEHIMTLPITHPCMMAQVQKYADFRGKR
jgi:hypothetical protein